jgi:hypothetical protein
LVNKLTNIDEFFDASNIAVYISSLSFVNIYYLSIQEWMIEILNNNNPTYPTLLSENNLWLFSGLNELYNVWSEEGPNSDINKLFNAFEVHTMDCILEVI